MTGSNFVAFVDAQQKEEQNDGSRRTIEAFSRVVVWFVDPALLKYTPSLL